MTLEIILLFSLALFSIGLYAVVARRNLIAVIIGTELMLNAAAVSFLGVGRWVDPGAVTAPIIVLFVIGLAAAEAALTLSIVVVVYRRRQSIVLDELNDLKH